MKKILVVEDDFAISDLIKLNLNMVGYLTNQAYDGLEALDLIKENSYDLIVLDIMLPKLDGYEVLSRIKEINIPVIFLTAKDSIHDRVYGLKIGADDYITKPFEAIELIARIEAVLRRYKNQEEIFEFKNIKIYEDKKLVTKDEELISMTSKEFDLLLLLFKNRDIALSRDKIIEKIWGFKNLQESRVVDIHIQKLRKKLNLYNEIKTIYKIGYRLEI
ncbi:response regulator transcription factor [Peptostreptococcaceae bacterium AGR-M142]